MKKPVSAARLALALALLLACGSAQSQLRAPAKASATESLGSGLYVPPTMTDARPAAAAEDERPPEAVIQDIADCVIGQLPKGWVNARIQVTEIGRDGGRRNLEATYSYLGADGKDHPFTPCDLREPAENIYKLNRALEPDKRNWSKATLVMSGEGKFELKYDYDKTEPKSEPAKPAAKSTRKK